MLITCVFRLTLESKAVVLNFHRVFALLALISLPLTPALAERRCGWIENPTPGNWWVSDGQGTWVLSAQGGGEVKGMDLMPDISEHDYVATNGTYGYACGCVDGTFDKDKSATEVTKVHQLPLATCRRDKSLPDPAN